MGIQSTQGFSFGLVANGVTLDLFKDEDIKVSDNVTGLFDLGTLPSDFTRQITLPGTRKNNDFFQHVYDISVTNPFLFSTNTKVEAYIDFDGFYLASGYLQLNKVNVVGNKYIESYEISIYGTVSSFAREINRNNITDLTNLTEYSHTASMAAITSSWEGDLFNYDIIYPLVDYGKNIEYDFAPFSYGINSASGALDTKDFKPAIKTKIIFDKIFDEYGFTYESDFMTSSIWDNMYLLCDNGLQYPVIQGKTINGFGSVKIGPISGSTTDNQLTAGTGEPLLWERTLEDPQGNMLSGGVYSLPQNSVITGEVNLVMQVSGSAGVPQFELQIATGSNPTTSSFTPLQDLDEINKFFREWDSSGDTGDVTHTLGQRFTSTPLVGKGDYVFRLKYTNFNGSNFTVTLAPDADEDSYIKIDTLPSAADFEVIRIADNLPFGESGIKQIDFIRGIQKKFNLVIYPSKTRPKHFKIETFNDWYKNAGVVSFNDYIHTDKKIEVIPANNLAVNELQFGDKLGRDFLAQTFEKSENRNYGTSYYIDNQNFFSQGKLDVESTFSVSPLRYLPGTGITGSANLVEGTEVNFIAFANSISDVCTSADFINVYSDSTNGFEVGATLFYDVYMTQPVTGFNYVAEFDSVYNLSSSTGTIGGFRTICFGTS